MSTQAAGLRGGSGRGAGGSAGRGRGSTGGKGAAPGRRGGGRGRKKNAAGLPPRLTKLGSEVLGRTAEYGAVSVSVPLELSLALFAFVSL